MSFVQEGEWREVEGPIVGVLHVDCFECGETNRVPIERDMKVDQIIICESCDAMICTITVGDEEVS